MTCGALRSLWAVLPRRGGVRRLGTSGTRPGDEDEEALASYSDLYRRSFVDHARKQGIDCECVGVKGKGTHSVTLMRLFVLASESASGLTHVDARGRANMVDVSDKGVTVRTAR